MKFLINKLLYVLFYIRFNIIECLICKLSSRPRKLKEIIEAEDEFRSKIWLELHLNSVENGDFEDDNTPENIKIKAFESAERIIEKYGEENLGPYDDFEAGMLWGKLTALRWVLGADWDFCDI